MKAILLAGGFGTRLRPLTLHTPKPVVPIFDQPFLFHQIRLLQLLGEIDEVILSLNYRPELVEQVIGDGSSLGVPIRYVVEPEPLGTGGAIRYAAQGVDQAFVVFNGDVLTDTNLPAVVSLHRERRAQATIVLTPVENPSAYGLVETDSAGNIQRFLEKPTPDEITCNTINAGIYVLEPSSLDRIPPHTPWSIERQYFPTLVEDGETFVAHIDHGYWLDIGTPDKYLQAHRDIMTGRCVAHPFADHPTHEPLVDTSAGVAADATVVAPAFVGAESRIESGARVGPHAVIGPRSRVGAGAVVEDSVLWPDTTVGEAATVIRSIVGRKTRLEDHTTVGPGVVVGDSSIVTS